MADFLDVPESHQFHSCITTLISNAITVGIGGGSRPWTCRRSGSRWRPSCSRHATACATFRLPAPTLFSDVPCPSAFANWTEQLVAEAITGGCGGGNYWPGNNNTRRQTAAFIVKTFYLQ